MEHNLHQTQLTAMDDNATKARDPDAAAASAGCQPVRSVMGGNTGNIRCGQQPRLTDFPALAALRLSGEDLEELSHQGFVGMEARGSLEFYKLRFRRAHQQVVRYIADAGQAAAIRAELARLQADHHLQRKLGRLTKRARRMLRASKKSLEPILETEGLKFHGLALRRPRKQKAQQ